MPRSPKTTTHARNTQRAQDTYNYIPEPIRVLERQSEGGLSMFRKCRDTARGQGSHVSAAHLQRSAICNGEEKGVADATKCILTPYGPPRARISHPGYLCRVGSDWNRDVSEGGGTPNSVRVRIPLGQFWAEVKRQRTTGGWLARTAVQVAARGPHAVGSTHRPLNKLCRGNHFGIPQRSVYSLGQTQRNCVVV